MKRRIISLGLLVSFVISILAYGNVFAKTEITVPERDIFSQSFENLTAVPEGWTLSGTEGTEYTFASDAVRAMAGKKTNLVYANGFDTDGHSYTFNFNMSVYNWSPYVIVGGYKITLHMASNSKYCDYYLDKMNSSGSYERIATGYDNGGYNYGYQALQSYSLRVDTEAGKVTLYRGSTELCSADDISVSTSGSVKFYLTSQNNTKCGVASSSLTVDEYTYWEYEEGEIERIDVDMQIGDYAAIGTYNGEAILWRCVDIDENGPLMLADSIISLKAFDAKGESTLGSHSRDLNDARIGYGSNYWNDSNIRIWLNSNASAGSVVYNCGNEPSEENVWSGYNEYCEESGFLSNDNFTALERSAMKVVSQKQILNSVDKNLATAGTAEHIYSPSVDDVLQNYNSAYSLNSSDKVFLLDIKQIQAVKENLGDYYMAKPTAASVNNSEFRDTEALSSSMNYRYWLRTPYASSDTEAYPEYVRYIDTDGSIAYSIYPAYSPLGIRPAFYLDEENAVFAAGEGTTTNPYTIGVDVNASGDYYEAGFTYERSSEAVLDQSFAYLSEAPDGWVTGGKNSSNIDFNAENAYATTINESGKAYATAYMNYTKELNYGKNYRVSSKRTKCEYNNYIYIYAGSSSASQTASSAPSSGYTLEFSKDKLTLYKDKVVKASSDTLTVDNTSVFAIEVMGNTVSGVIYTTANVEKARISFTDSEPINSGYCGCIFNSVRYPKVYDFKIETIYETEECTRPFIFEKTFTSADTQTSLVEEGFLLRGDYKTQLSFTDSGATLTSTSAQIIAKSNDFFGNYTFDWVSKFSYNSAGAYVNYVDASNYYRVNYGSISGLNTVSVTKVLDGVAYTLYKDNTNAPGFSGSTALNRINVITNYDGSVTLDISIKGGAYKIAITDIPADSDGDPVLRGSVGVFTTNTPATIPYIKAYTTPVTAGNTPVYSINYRINNIPAVNAETGDTSVQMPVISVGKEGKIIAAAYDGNKLIEVKILDIYDFYGNNKIKVFNTSDYAEAELKLKLFTWDDMNTLVPVDEPKEL